MRSLIIFLLIVVSAVGVGLYFAFIDSPITRLGQEELYNPLVSASYEEVATVMKEVPQNKPPEEPVKQSTFDELFKKYAEDYAEIELSISVVDITQNKKYTYNPDRINIGASTTKLFTASAFLSELEKGKYTFDSKIGSYNARFQIQQLINQSNNNSWELFYNTLGRTNIEKYAQAIGSTNFNINENSLHADDITNYLTQLYNNKLHSEENTKYLLSLMQNTNDDTFIPKGLTSHTLYHKNGQLEEVVNEAVLAVGDKSTFAIGIYTDGKDKWEYTKRRELIQNLIKDILK